MENSDRNAVTFTTKVSPFFATLGGTVTHLRRFTDELAALHHGFDVHVEVLVSGVVVRDAAEGIHSQLLLNRQQLQSGCFHTTPHTKVTFQDHNRAYLRLWGHEADAFFADRYHDGVGEALLARLLRWDRSEHSGEMGHLCLSAPTLTTSLTLASKKLQPNFGHVDTTFKKRILASCTVMSP